MALHFASPQSALVRGVPGSFDGALRAEPVPLDVERARTQHSGYVAALETAGVTVEWLEADARFPDCCFIEDTAVVVDTHRLLTRPGAPSRVGEVDAVAARLGGVRLPGRLDGGDVLRVGPWLFVGESSRSDREGALALAAASGLELVGVPAGGLHLKSLVTGVDAQTVIAVDGVDLAPFRERGLRCLTSPEPEGGNVLPLGDVVLVSSKAPRAADVLDAGGWSPKLLEVDELHRADGGLTCLSIRIPRERTWCY